MAGKGSAFLTLGSLFRVPKCWGGSREGFSLAPHASCLVSVDEQGSAWTAKLCAQQKSKMLSRCRRRHVIGCLCLQRTLVLTCLMQVFRGVECTLACCTCLSLLPVDNSQWHCQAGHLQRSFVSLLHDSHVLHLLTCYWTPGQQEASQHQYHVQEPSAVSRHPPVKSTVNRHLKKDTFIWLTRNSATHARPDGVVRSVTLLL